MKYFLYFLIFSVALYSCNNSGSGGILYKNVYSINIHGLNKKKSAFNALIAFENQHEKGSYKLKEIDVDIVIDGIDMGTYFSRQPLNIKSQSELKVPLEYAIDPSKIENADGGYASSFVVSLKGNAIFTDEHGTETNVSFTHKETVYPVVPKREKKSAKKGKQEDKENKEELSKSEQRKLNRELKRERKKELKVQEDA